MKEHLPIRQLSTEERNAHLETFRTLAIESYKVYEQGLGPEAFKGMMDNFTGESFWQELFAKADAFICEDGNTCVGMGFLVPSGNPWRFVKAEWSFVRLVGVLPSMQGRGIARRLMQTLLEAARSRGEKTVALHTSEIMHAARHLYEDMGFVIDHELERRGNARYWVYTLELDR